MSDGGVAYRDVTAFDDFARVADPAVYQPLPDDWVVAITDVVSSTRAIAEGRYKQVNMAGAASISAVKNALDGKDIAFVFGGDGASMAVEPGDAEETATALRQVSRWALDELSLDLRVGLIPVSEIRQQGHDVRVGRYAASDAVAYAAFSGGGLEWATGELKAGRIDLGPAPVGYRPDLSGLSCQWGAIPSRNGQIVSLMVHPADGGDPGAFADIVRSLMDLADGGGDPNPVPEAGPMARWPFDTFALQMCADRDGRALPIAFLKSLIGISFAWIVLKTGLRLPRFDPAHYRRQITQNTDFRKFDDCLRMTVDCTPETADAIEALLSEAETGGHVRFGMHRQESALMTCVVPSASDDGHFHFLDGSDGGYALAAQLMNEGRETA